MSKLVTQGFGGGSIVRQGFGTSSSGGGPGGTPTPGGGYFAARYFGHRYRAFRYWAGGNPPAKPVATPGAGYFCGKYFAHRFKANRYWAGPPQPLAPQTSLNGAGYFCGRYFAHRYRAYRFWSGPPKPAAPVFAVPGAGYFCGRYFAHGYKAARYWAGPPKRLADAGYWAGYWPNRYWAKRYWSGVPRLRFDLRRAIVHTLRTDPPTAAMVGNRVYLLKRPQRAPMPCVEYEVISNVLDANLDGGSGVAWARVQFTFWAWRFDQCRMMAILAGRLFEGLTQVDIQGCRILACVQDDAGDHYDEPADGSDDGPFHLGVDFKFMYQLFSKN